MMANMKSRSVPKIVAVLAIMLLFVVLFFVIGLFVDIQIILKYNHTPIPFTFILPFIGALIGILVALAPEINGGKCPKCGTYLMLKGASEGLGRVKAILFLARHAKYIFSCPKCGYEIMKIHLGVM